MSYTFVTRLDRAEIDRFLYSDAGPIRRGVDDWGRQVQVVARRRAPRKTGKLLASIYSRSGVVIGVAVFVDIGTPLDYGYWQHQGTGVYSGRGPIFPLRGRAMRFVPSIPAGPLTAAGHFFARPMMRHPAEIGLFVYARSVQGIPPLPYLTSALADVTGMRVGVSGAVTRLRTFTGVRRR